jgi:hypothetical protein
MNNELEIIWKETIMAQFEVLFCHLLGCTEANHETLRIANLCAKIWNWNLPGIKKEYWQLGHDILSYIQSAIEQKLITFFV